MVVTLSYSCERMQVIGWGYGGLALHSSVVGMIF